jgi:uncharacterized membrane protein
MKNRNKTHRIVVTGIVAALYAALTIGLAPISYGGIQFRISEVMTLLAFINPLYIGGLTLGCFLANLASPLGIIDVIFGTFATFLSVWMMSKTTHIFVASLWPVLFNGVIIGIELWYVFQLPLFLTMFQVAFGEFVVVSVLGVLVFRYGILHNVRLMDFLNRR